MLCPVNTHASQKTAIKSNNPQLAVAQSHRSFGNTGYSVNARSDQFEQFSQVWAFAFFAIANIRLRSSATANDFF